MATLGDQVTDKVTKMKGIVTAVSQNLYGCDRAYVQPQAGKDMKVPDGFWCDIDSLTVNKKSVIKGHINKPSATKVGGPMSRIK